MSNVKKGDLAVVVGCYPGTERALGHVCTIIGKEPHPLTGALGWRHTPSIPGTDWDCTLDIFLRPIRGTTGNEHFVTESRKSLPRPKPATAKGDTIDARGELHS